MASKFNNDQRMEFILSHCEILYRDQPVEDLDELDHFIDNFEPSDNSEDWSGGFADNH